MLWTCRLWGQFEGQPADMLWVLLRTQVGLVLTSTIGQNHSHFQGNCSQIYDKLNLEEVGKLKPFLHSRGLNLSPLKPVYVPIKDTFSLTKCQV